MKPATLAAITAAVAVAAGTAGHYIAQPSATAQSCSYRADGVLPDPVCTPGATNPTVTPATLQTTICQSGWTKTIRPSASVTGPMKRLSMRQYGAQGLTRDYEYDHLISLQLGGAPQDPRNLWPEPYTEPGPANDARDKDTVETRLKRAVCAGRTSLAAAQRLIATDWRNGLP